MKEMWAGGQHTGNTGGRSSPAAIPSSPWHTRAHSREGKMKNLCQDSQLSPLPVLLSKTTLQLAAVLVCCQDTWLLKVSVAKALLKHLVPLCAVV